MLKPKLNLIIMGGCCTRGHGGHQNNYTLNTIFGTTVSEHKSFLEKPRDKMAKRGTVALHIANMVRRKSVEIHKEYKFMDILGKGAYGEVRKATHRITGMIRAIKSVSKVDMKTEQKLRLINEVEILKNLDHPNIIRVYEFFEDSVFFYIVTELCVGGELFDRIMEKTIVEENESAVIMRQILSAVFYFHSKNIVHRDLKPENILYESKKAEAQVKITDFGTSRVFMKNEELTNTYGTVYYIAPEVLKGKYTGKCDVWSCGIILYVLLCGFPPFGGTTDNDIMERIKRGPIPFDSFEWEDVSQEAKSLISAMCNYDTDRRLTASQALEHSWIQKRIDRKNSKEKLSKVLKNLKNFRVSFSLSKI